jgi:hypothetical protein
LRNEESEKKVHDDRIKNTGMEGQDYLHSSAEILMEPPERHKHQTEKKPPLSFPPPKGGVSENTPALNPFSGAQELSRRKLTFGTGVRNCINFIRSRHSLFNYPQAHLFPVDAPATSLRY